MGNSDFLSKARKILDGALSHPFSSEQRKEKAVELAGLMLQESRRIETYLEQRQQRRLGRMMDDPIGKAFTTCMTDQCFRSSCNSRVADQMIYLIKKFGIPKFLSPLRKIQLLFIRYFGKSFAYFTIPLTRWMLCKEISKVIIPDETKRFSKYMKKRRNEGVKINLNHLGEAILGEEEAERRLNRYLKDLADPNVEYISIKISTIFSQISLLGWEETLKVLENRLKRLYRASLENDYLLPNGTKVPKFVNLDMEEYRDLHLTVALFKRVLEDAEFYRFSAGIVLQAYLPDAFLFQQELTVWAMQRVANGGAPIKIRLVKGANLAMEQLEAAMKGWPQAPYLSKGDTDANFKRMLVYACEPKRARAIHIGIGSHNLFDIAYGMILRVEKGIERYVNFEMLEGMANPICRVIQSLGGGMLLYCPLVARNEFQNAIAYLVRRLDENTTPENFLRHAFEMIPGTAEWQRQADLFSLACDEAEEADFAPRRQDSRFIPPASTPFKTPFENEPDTDWALPQNVKWAEMILRRWSERQVETIPVVVGGKEHVLGLVLEAKADPSYLEKTLYRYGLCGEAEIEIALKTAVDGMQSWEKVSLEERLLLIDKAAYELRCHRGDLIGAMMADTGKTIAEADVEVSEAIDFAAYYRRSVEELHAMKDIKWIPKGPVLVAPPWNFPCSIPAGGILAALAAGNTVIFKPAPEAVLVGWQLVNTLWKTGIGKDVLQFLCCPDDPIGTRMIQDPRLAVVILTGATSTAKRFLKLRPGIDLIAETGGKNALIITRMADRDLAIKDLLQSAFGHAGQKCSACSLAILEMEVYDDHHFRRQLRDAAASFKVGLPWDLSTKINPLIRKPGAELLRALTTLEEGEEWLLKPKQDPNNANLWSPGIKLGVKPGSFTHQTEVFGPLLGVMRANDLRQAIEWANGTPYGLTAGIHTLDEREQKIWSEKIIAGNLYINRTITGAIVQRQPFGGSKESSFGPGIKAGGPNYVIQLMRPQLKGLPMEREPIDDVVMKLSQLALRKNVSSAEGEAWTASIGNYAFCWNHYFSKCHDPSHIGGQNNFFYYKPHRDLVLRVQNGDSFLDILKVIAASHTCGTHLEVSIAPGQTSIFNGEQFEGIPALMFVTESDAQLIVRIKSKLVKRIRFLSPPTGKLQEILADVACHHMVAPVLANGRLELLHFLSEVSLSVDYHRYGYIHPF